jgi:predicted amidohydrolase YtcJ
MAVLDMYPTRVGEQSEPWQYPKTPKLTPSLVASGIPLTTGADMTESKSNMNETSSKAVNGVAGLSMAAEVGLSAQLALDHAMRAMGSRKDGVRLPTV